MQAIEERWGLFLKHLDYSKIEQCRKQFDNLIENIKSGYKTSKVIENPSYFIRMGNAFIEHANSYKMRIFNTIGYYNSFAHSVMGSSGITEFIYRAMDTH